MTSLRWTRQRKRDFIQLASAPLRGCSCPRSFAAAISLTWLGSADPPIDTRDSTYSYRPLRRIPGLTESFDGVRNYSWGKLSFASSYEPVGGFGSGAYTRYTTPVLNAWDEISLRCRADPPSSNSLRPDPAVAGWTNR
jgi:hypothetical protein